MTDPTCLHRACSPARQVAGACLLLAAAAGWAAPDTEAPAQPVAASPAALFVIKGFTITGDNPLGEGETARILAPFLRTNATIDTLRQATAALEDALRVQGYGLYRVALPPQDLGEVVSLNIVKFTVNKVGIEGRQRYDEANVRRTLPELREGQTPNFKRLAVQTAIANENPNKQVQVGIRESEETDKIDATIKVRELSPLNFAVTLSNAGSRATGRDRFTAFGSHTNLFNRDHQFTGAYTTSLQRPSDVRQVGLAYRVPLYSLGSVVGLTYTRSDVVGTFGGFSSTGAGRTVGGSYTLYLAPDGGRRSYVTLAVEDKVFNATRIDDVVVPGQFDRRSRPLSLSYTARTEAGRSLWAYTVEAATNAGGGKHNDLTSYRSEDPRIDTTHWKAVRGNMSYFTTLANNWSWNLRGQFQYSPDVLISGEQFGLGGPNSVRGTDIERPISGDIGLSGMVELMTPEVAQGLRLLGFVDGGWLSNNGLETAAKPSTDHLASAGLGLRFNRGPAVFAADYGRLLRGSRVPLALNSASPQKGDHKIYVSLSVRF